MQFRNIRSSTPEVVKNLIIINVLFLLGTWALPRMGINLSEQLGLFYFESKQFRAWQMLSHFFMHGGTMHLVFNMFAIWMFGSRLEQLWGPKRFLSFYFVTATGAFLLHAFVQYLQLQQVMPLISAADYQEVYENGRQLLVTGRNYSDPALNKLNGILNINVVGASGAVFGVLAAFAMYFPNTRLMLLFPPIPIKAKYFVLIYAGFELFSGVANFQGDNVAHFAHLGGALFGFLMVKYWNKNNKSSLY
jgi:membrane associated rhomboid family serine protease